MAKKSIKQIVQEELPDMEVVEGKAAPASDAARKGTRPGPSSEELRKKFLGKDAPASDAKYAGAKKPDPSKVKVFQARPKKAPADPVDDPGPRTLIADEDGLVGGRG